jgi:hypothetical protein
MEYISAKEAAAKWGLTARMVIYHCSNGRIGGAQKIAGVWLVPGDAPRPEDRRKGNGRRPSADRSKQGNAAAI